jgi:hypothetical protein
MPDVFPLWHIALNAAVLAAVSLIALLAAQWRLKPPPLRSLGDAIAVSVVIGLVMLAWRSVANVAELNRDPVPRVSPNDALSLVVAYVGLGLYASFTRPADARRWEQTRALLALIALVVNIAVI